MRPKFLASLLNTLASQQSLRGCASRHRQQRTRMERRSGALQRQGGGEVFGKLAKNFGRKVKGSFVLATRNVHKRMR